MAIVQGFYVKEVNLHLSAAESGVREAGYIFSLGQPFSQSDQQGQPLLLEQLSKTDFTFPSRR